jgi:putative selenate reductase
MNDKFKPTPLLKLLQIILYQYEKQKSIFGIPEELFFTPSASDPFRFKRFGKLLENPVGLAAGPHTQLAQNIVSAWLCGARYIELKTIQTLDELDVSKPCIDMQDEGYNCEWSQELKIHQSFEQYLDAWIIIHVLKHLFEGNPIAEPGFIFNMSVGYNLEGIKNENVQWFLNKIKDASFELEEKMKQLKPIYPKIQEIRINPCISDNITLSTMHGCPPEEIEKIGLYLLEEKELHTTIKLNPTLLGKDELLLIMQQSGFDTIVPDLAFEHDLKYDQAVNIIKNLHKTAERHHLHFGLKLTNTLESINNKDIFPKKEKMMYMSGVPLHPIAINLAYKLQKEFNGELDISFSAGLDAFNVVDVVSCGLYPATVCSDILKPGGYGRLHQYIENLKDSFSNSDSSSISEFICRKSGLNDGNERTSALKNLGDYVESLNKTKTYQKKSIKTLSIKTNMQLSTFDCIFAPCQVTCPTQQGIPDYMYYAAHERFEEAKKVILQTNPFPKTTGMVCDHICQSRCTRINYDDSLLIKEIKQSISVNSNFSFSRKDCMPQNGRKVAIIGAGPSGLACAYFLKLSGFDVQIYEKNDSPGGMVYHAIPKFRLNDQDLALDIKMIISLGVSIDFNFVIDNYLFKELVKQNDFVYIAVGAQLARPFSIPGADCPEVLDPIKFLFRAKAGQSTNIGKKVVVIGGGNTAMDAVITCHHLLGGNGSVKLIYRRSIKQMPANEEEIKALIDENIDIIELVNPLKINSRNGKLQSLLCQKMQLGEKDTSGRAKPVPIEGSEFEIECDTIIPAVGQETDIGFIDDELLKIGNGTYETLVPNVFMGGDALNGGLSIIAAIGDGRKVAQLIIDKSAIDFKTKKTSERPTADYRDLMIRKSKRIKTQNVKEIDHQKKNSFDLALPLLNMQDTIREASRCLLCDELCSICTSTCPNLALFAYPIQPFVLRDKDGKIIFEIKQDIQILHVADWCNQCGNCKTFCPSSGAPWEKKPHLYLDKTGFDNTNEGYYFNFNDLEPTLRYKNGSEFYSLAENTTNYSYIAPVFSAEIEKQTFKIQNVNYFDGKGELNLIKAVEMNFILVGARHFFGINKI